MSRNEERYDFLVHTIFSGVMAKEEKIVDKILDYAAMNSIFALENGELLFTLPALFGFLLYISDEKENEEFSSETYKAFRRMLYKMPTNTLLKQQGWVVTIEKSHRQQGLRVYRLGHLK